MTNKRGLTGVFMLFVLATLAACGGGGGGGGGGGANNNPRFAYVANAGDDTVSVYRVDAVTGQLHHQGYAQAGSLPVSVTVGPSGRFAYVANAASNNVTTFSINPATGVLTEVGTEVAAGDGAFSVTVLGGYQ